MESIQFFITHSFLLHLLLAVLSFLGGLAMGWWVWSKFEDQARETDRLLVSERERSAKLMREKQEWSNVQSVLQRRVSELEAAHAGFTTDQSAWAESKARLELEIRDGRKLTETIENELSSCREERHQLIQSQRETESRLEKTDQSLTALRQQLAVALNDREVLTKARADLQQQVTQAAAEMRSVRQQLDSISEARASAETSQSSLQNSLSKLEAELSASRPQIASLQQKLEQLSQEREQHLKARQELETHQEKLEQEVVRLKNLAQSHAREKEAAGKNQGELESRLRQAEQRVEELQAQISAQVASVPPPTPASPPKDQAAPAEPKPAAIPSSAEGVNSNIPSRRQASTDSEPAAVSDEDALPLFSMTPRTESAPSPRAVSEQENMRQDPLLGWVYTVKPSAKDDLGELWGVADVIVEKLNACGVFTFRQIALWDDRIIEAISERLEVFPERVRRDDWVNQAKDLHFRKYGERV